MVFNGEPVSSFNRTVVWVPFNGCSVETGSIGAVKTCSGKIKNIERLGRVTVDLEDHLRIVQQWIGEALKESNGDAFEDIIQGVEARMDTLTPPNGKKTVVLDVFSAIIVNNSRDNVFKYKTPSSFP
jgi:hypothetical protein